jgi:hypothetical protein
VRKDGSNFNPSKPSLLGGKYFSGLLGLAEISEFSDFELL